MNAVTALPAGIRDGLAVTSALETPQQAARRLSEHKLREGYKPEALHEYRDADATPLYWRIRCRRSDGDKWVRPMRWNGAGYELGEPEFAHGKPLYGLDRLAADRESVVFVVEGEKAADALLNLGILATTSGSCSSADGADWTPLRARSCVVWPDHDEPGAKYAMDAVRHLKALACDVQLIDKGTIDALPIHGDVVDWIAQHTDANADTIRALPTIPAPEPVTQAGPGSVELIDLASVKPEPIRWLWPGWLARGKLHVLAGAPGTGKTTLVMDWAACVSAGRALPSGHRPEPGRVLIWSGEDDVKDTLAPRLIAAHADMTRVRAIGDVTENGQRFPFDPARDVDKLAGALAGMDDVTLIVIDPLVSAVMGDSHKNAEVRRSLQPLVELAMRMDAALVGITHYSKGTQGREPLERVSGSLAFGALARVVLGTVRMQQDDETAPSRLMLARCKSNIGPDGGGFTYAFEQVELSDYGGLSASRIVYGSPVEGTARELLAEAEPGDASTQDAASFLHDLLADGSRLAREVFAEASAAGYSKDAMHRAKRKIGATAVKTGMDGGWVWRIDGPEGGAEGCEGGGQNRPPSSPSSGVKPPSSDAGNGVEVTDL